MARDTSPDDVRVPFLFVPDGETPPADWLAAHSDAIRIPATFVPRDPAEPTRGGASCPTTTRGHTGPPDRFGNPYRPFSEYGPDERAPGEGMPDAPSAAPDLDAAVAAYRQAEATFRTATGNTSGQVAATGAAAGSPGDTTVLAADTAAAPPVQPASPAPTMLPESRDVGIDEHDPTAPVPLVDDRGRPVLRGDGTPIMRPAGLDPHMFVAAGQRDRQRILIMLPAGANPGAVSAEILPILVHVWKFQQWHSWDAQRVGGEYHPEFVDYATIAIGLYAAAAGIPRDIILDVEDYIASSSHYKDNPKMDQTYTHLPTRNVQNTDLGHELYESGRIGAADTSGGVP